MSDGRLQSGNKASLKVSQYLILIVLSLWGYFSNPGSRFSLVWRSFLLMSMGSIIEAIPKSHFLRLNLSWLSDCIEKLSPKCAMRVGLTSYLLAWSWMNSWYNYGHALSSDTVNHCTITQGLGITAIYHCLFRFHNRRKVADKYQDRIQKVSH